MYNVITNVSRGVSKVSEPIKKNIINLAIPLFLMILLFSLMGIVDTLMLSKYSDNAVASVGNANRVMTVFLVSLNIIAIGVGVVVSQFLGAKEEKKAKDTIKVGIYVNFAVGLILVILVTIFNKGLFSLLHTDASILSDSSVYLKIVGYSLVFASVTNASFQGLTSFGKGIYITAVVLVTNILNVCLNALLIYGSLGFPRLGVEGAAIATLISRAVTFIASIAFLYFVLKINIFSVYVKDIKGYLYKMIRVGLPSALEEVFYDSTQFVILIFINIIGVYAVTSFSYLVSIMMITITFSLSIAIANQILVGYFIGEDDNDSSYERTMKTYVRTIPVVIFISVLLFIFSSSIFTIFTSDPLILKTCKECMFFLIILEVGRLTNFTFLKALQSTGDVFFAPIIGLFSMVLMSIPLAWFLGVYLDLGLVGIFIALTVDECLRGMLGFARWRSRAWVGKSLVK